MLTGVILAGGQNRRMNGKMKALLSIHGETIVEKQINEMKKICQEIYIITHSPELFLHVDAQIFSDLIPDQGPLGGIHTALTFASYPSVWIVAGDMPFISSQVARWFVHELNLTPYDVILPQIMSKMHPLHALYSKKCTKPMAHFLRQGNRKVTQFLEQIDYITVDESFFQEKKIDLRFVTNINTPEEYKKYKEYTF